MAMHCGEIGSMKLAAFLQRFARRLTLYIPISIMGALALGSWWLAKNAPTVDFPEPERAQRQDPDYDLTQFSMKNFDVKGVLISELIGAKARHFPATDTLEVDEARFRMNRDALITSGRGDRGYSNGDGTEVQLVGNAVVIRDASKDAQGQIVPRTEFKGDFLHVFARTEEVKSHKPVKVKRGGDQFSGDVMAYNKIDGILQLDGRVRVRLESRADTDAR
jgi:lipopolysaccharide export system protein LptC